ncbi:hypothetical protein [Enhygromyxa salina]|uniref:Uncharacterized protein n=1 Tax=Enhygromyxa salina TaxID=215803 RepID=A0A2S9Y0A6_9BACT|nr:hypothetical protein [Enhygromyxa salina]PRP98526.1 hypothetical protein ENSA7_64690 [Enhygromyxa salina]
MNDSPHTNETSQRENNVRSDETSNQNSASRVIEDLQIEKLQAEIAKLEAERQTEIQKLETEKSKTILKSAVELEAERMRVEIAKLQAEKRLLEANADQKSWGSWTIRTLFPTLVGAAAVAACSALFSDSLQERTRAEVQQEVLKTYFTTENGQGGKRLQILAFVESVIDDDTLWKWAQAEKGKAEDARVKAAAYEAELYSELEEQNNQMVKLQEARDNFVEMMASSDVINFWRTNRRPPKSVPGEVGSMLSQEQNGAMLSLMEVIGAAGIRKLDNCDEAAKTRSSNSPKWASLAEECRVELIVWATDDSKIAKDEIDDEIRVLRNIKRASQSLTLSGGDSPLGG